VPGGESNPLLAAEEGWQTYIYHTYKVTPQNRFFSSVSFVDPKMVMSSTDVFVGVPVGRTSFLSQQNYAPQVTLANFGSNEVQATVQYAQSSKDSVTFRDLMSISVPAMSSKEVIFSGLEGNPELKNSFLVTSNAVPGDLVSKLLSKGNAQPRQVELLARDAMAPENGGNHPWSLVGGIQSFLLLFNNDQRLQTFSVAIAGAHALWRKTYTLQPMQTQLVDIGAILRNKVRDDHGLVLPSDLASGEASWFNTAGSGRGRILEVNSTIGLARNFSCFVFAAPCTPASVSLSPSTITVGGQSSAQVNYQICAAPDQFTCAGPPASGTPDFPTNWSSQNTSIANAAGGNQFATVTGVGAGTTGIIAEVSNEFGNCHIPASANVTVQVPTASKITQTLSSHSISKGSSPCGAGQGGWFRQVQKIVTDQNGSNMVLGGQNLTEVVTIGTPHNLGIGKGQTGTAVTNASGHFNDTLLVCSSVCPGSSGQTNATQTIKDTLSSGSGPYNLSPNTFVYKCTGITINGL
jgi:hypothetical protein